MYKADVAMQFDATSSIIALPACALEAHSKALRFTTILYLKQELGVDKSEPPTPTATARYQKAAAGKSGFAKQMKHQCFNSFCRRVLAVIGRVMSTPVVPAEIADSGRPCSASEHTPSDAEPVPITRPDGQPSSLSQARPPHHKCQPHVTMPPGLLYRESEAYRMEKGFHFIADDCSQIKVSKRLKSICEAQWKQSTAGSQKALAAALLAPGPTSASALTTFLRDTKQRAKYFDAMGAEMSAVERLSMLNLAAITDGNEVTELVIKTVFENHEDPMESLLASPSVATVIEEWLAREANSERLGAVIKVVCDRHQNAMRVAFDMCRRSCNISELKCRECLHHQLGSSLFLIFGHNFVPSLYAVGKANHIEDAALQLMLDPQVTVDPTPASLVLVQKGMPSFSVTAVHASVINCLEAFFAPMKKSDLIKMFHPGNFTIHLKFCTDAKWLAKWSQGGWMNGVSGGCQVLNFHFEGHPLSDSRSTCFPLAIGFVDDHYHQQLVHYAAVYDEMAKIEACLEGFFIEALLDVWDHHWECCRSSTDRSYNWAPNSWSYSQRGSWRIIFDAVPDGAARTNQSITLPNCSNATLSGGYFHQQLAHLVAVLDIPLCRTYADQCAVHETYFQSEYCHTTAYREKAAHDLCDSMRKKGESTFQQEHAHLALHHLQSCLVAVNNLMRKTSQAMAAVSNALHTHAHEDWSDISSSNTLNHPRWEGFQPLVSVKAKCIAVTDVLAFCISQKLEKIKVQAGQILSHVAGGCALPIAVLDECTCAELIALRGFLNGILDVEQLALAVLHDKPRISLNDGESEATCNPQLLRYNECRWYIYWLRAASVLAACC